MSGRPAGHGLLAGGAVVTAAVLAAVVGVGSQPRAAAGTGGAATDVAAGVQVSCAAQPSGQVVCWGLDVFAHPAENKIGTARPFRIAGLERVKWIALGYDSLCAIDAGGDLRCVGTRPMGSGGGPDGAREVEGIAQVALSGPFSMGGGPHACAVRRDGTVACWGSNASGELGAGDRVQRAGPVDVAGVTDAAQVSAGDGLSCARLRGGRVLCWGRRLGLRDPQGDPLHPTMVPGLDDAVSLSSGGKLTCAARARGSVVCWGHGAFGVPGRVQIDAPTPIPGVSGAVEVAVGANETACARTAAGGVVCWGSGALGDGKLSLEAAPVMVPGLRDVAQVTVGASASCARTRAGAVYCWGRNEMGEAGQPPQLQPASRPLPDRPHAARLAASDDHICFIGAAGEVSCRGPIGIEADRARRLGPVAEIAMGGRHACLRRPDGHVLCWGENDDGQLGDRTRAASAEPAPTVPPIDDARAIAASVVRTCALRANGSLTCWGGSGATDGPVAMGGFVDAVEVALGDDFVCARRREGEVACFGGRFGAHAFGPELALAHREQPPPTIAALSPARAIGARNDQLCALRRDGVVACTGGGRGFTGHRGEVNLRLDPQRLIRAGADAVALAVGKAHACLLRGGGGVACWGDGGRGQLGGGVAAAVAAQAVEVAGLAGAQEIVSGDDQTCARLKDGEVRCWGFDSDGRLTGTVASLRPGRVDLP